MTLTLKEKWHRYICEEEYIGYEFYLDDLLCGDGYVYIGTKEINRFGNLGIIFWRNINIADMQRLPVIS